MAAVAKRIYKTGSRFEQPSGVVSKTIELGTYPLQLASEYTPSNLKSTELFKAGYEPTEVSTRFSKLENPTNGKSTYDGYGFASPSFLFYGDFELLFFFLQGLDG